MSGFGFAALGSSVQQCDRLVNRPLGYHVGGFGQHLHHAPAVQCFTEHVHVVIEFVRRIDLAVGTGS